MITTVKAALNVAGFGVNFVKTWFEARQNLLISNCAMCFNTSESFVLLNRTPSAVTFGAFGFLLGSFYIHNDVFALLVLLLVLMHAVFLCRDVQERMLPMTGLARMCT